MKYTADFSRRQFVKTFTFGTAFSIFLGKPWRGTVFAELQPAGQSNPGILRVKLTDYPALLSDFGSVRLGVNPIDGFSGPIGLFYPIIINRASANVFHALDSYCRHQGCVVPVFDEFEGLMRCPCHGSAYAIDGSLVAGPAVSSLIRYPSTFDGVNTLSIQLPELGYTVDIEAVDSSNGSRLQLDFPTMPAVEYEVLFRLRIHDPWTVAPFSLDLESPADQTSYIGDSLPATVFVDHTTIAGFYSVAIKILDLTEG